MGKPFATELAHIADTLNWAQALDVSLVADFLGKAEGSPLVMIGAGGSFTTVEMARLLFESRGGFGIAHTPLSFLQNKSDLRQSQVILWTAGGNNRDALAAFQAAVEREARSILVVCGATRSKIEGNVARCDRAELFAAPLPTGKDGYLATNSLVAFCAIAIRAFGHALPSPKVVNKIMTASNEAWHWNEDTPTSHFYLTIYGDWARPA
jgi:fructoselysine-6-P-deglycase FrlB-like protein